MDFFFILFEFGVMVVVVLEEDKSMSDENPIY